MIDILEEQTQLRGTPDEAESAKGDSGEPAVVGAGPSFAARARVILLLSLLSWAILGGVLALLFALIDAA